MKKREWLNLPNILTSIRILLVPALVAAFFTMGKYRHLATLLIFFAAGVLVGLLAAVPSWFRQRREIARLQRELRHATRPESVVAAPAPAEAAVGPGVGLGV